MSRAHDHGNPRIGVPKNLQSVNGYMLERGERLPSFPVAIRIANLFDASVSDLLAKPVPASPTAVKVEPWMDEATAILGSLHPQTLEIVLAMLRAASAISRPSGAAREKKRRGGRSA